MHLIKKLLLNDKIIVAVVILNVFVIFLQESGIDSPAVNTLDIGCTLIFLFEMIVKNITYGPRKYWTNALNCMDGLLVLISVPSIVTLFMPLDIANLSSLLVLRIFRIFRFFRVVRMFPNISVILNNFKLALRQSYAIIVAFVVIIITFSLIGCSMFGDAAPQFFDSPLNAIYTTFRLFTIEGWYEIPDAVAEGMHSAFWGHLIKLYFCTLLIGGGIIGMSLINSIFVDAMVSDNNDDIKEQLKRMEAKMDALTAKLSEMSNKDGRQNDKDA